MEIKLTNRKTQQSFMALDYLSKSVTTESFLEVIEVKRKLKQKSTEVDEFYLEVGKKLNIVDASGNISAKDEETTKEFNNLTKDFLEVENTFEIKQIPVSSLSGQKLQPSIVEYLMDCNIII